MGLFALALDQVVDDPWETYEEDERQDEEFVDRFFYGKEPLATVVQDVVGEQEVCPKLRLHAGHGRIAGPGSVCHLCLRNWHTHVDT